jgi:hypothetical protein
MIERNAWTVSPLVLQRPRDATALESSVGATDGYSGLGQAFGAVRRALAASEGIAEVRSAKHGSERLAGIGCSTPISHWPTIQSTLLGLLAGTRSAIML